MAGGAENGGPTRTRRRRSFQEWVNGPKVAGWLLVVAAAVCAVFAVGTYGDAVALRDHGVRTRAEVLEVHDGRSSYVVLRFTAADGREVTAQVGNYSWSPTPRPGDEPTVVYDPQDPEGNVADVRSGPDFLGVWLLGGGALVAAALVRPTFTGRIDWSR